MTLPSGAFPFDSQSGTARGVGGGDRSTPRWGSVLALLVTTALAVGLGALVLTLVPGDDPAPPAPPPRDTAQGCTATFGPTPDLAGLLGALTPGDVACLSPGVYGERGVRTDWSASGEPDAPIELRAADEGTVLVRGFVNLAGSHLVVDGLVFDGPTGAVSEENSPSGEQVLVWAQGDDITIRRCEVRDGLWRAGIYVSGRDVLIDACWVHDNGPWFDPDQVQDGGLANNIDHGVYFGDGSSGTLSNSLVEHNLAYGVQISAGAQDVTVTSNTIVRNGAGGVIWAEDTSGSLLVNNIIALNDGYAVNAHLLTGQDNVARNNLAWGNGRGEWNDNGPLVTRRNGVADPKFVSQRDYRLQADSPAVHAADRAHAPAGDHDGLPRPQGAGPDLGAFERPANPAP